MEPYLLNDWKVIKMSEFIEDEDKIQSVLAMSKEALKEALARLFEEEDEIPESRWREFLK